MSRPDARGDGQDPLIRRRGHKSGVAGVKPSAPGVPRNAGKPAPPPDSDALYEPCVSCRGAGCACGGLGFVATGYTTGRLDRLRAEADRLLMLLDDLRAVVGDAAVVYPELGHRPSVQLLRLVLAGRVKDLEAARSRTRPFAAAVEHGLLVLKTGRRAE